MASHRKPRNRTRILTAPGPRAVVGFTTVALATVTLFSETANAAPATQSIAQVQSQVDKLYQQAEVATERYDGAKTQTDQQRTKADQLLEQVARKTAKLNDVRRTLGEYATAQYRSGGLDQTASFLLASDPQALLDQAHTMDRMSTQEAQVLDDYRTQQAAISTQRTEAVQSLSKLTTSQQSLQTEKKTVQTKLAAAQKLLNSLTAQQKAKLAALQKQQEAAATKKAVAFAAKSQSSSSSSSSSSSGTSTGTSTGTGSSSAYATKAAKAIAFAQAQLGKPYVYGATGPNSYDCSGLTQAAWAAAGISIPRTTYTQINAGTRVSASQLQPGDLVFFYSGVSHVGLYIGGGMMIHAPHTGTVVKIAPITEMPIAGYARVA
ncbi:MAG: peptidoglycan DL-endopeptidase CwlO [Streptomycetaceae bacterium]|nr:peptidoglycan DL-endopeptidase CwlO [Streptomycetaceae bacterium]